MPDAPPRRCRWWRRALRSRLAPARAAISSADDVVLVLVVLCGILAVLWALAVLAP